MLYIKYLPQPSSKPTDSGLFACSTTKWLSWWTFSMTFDTTNHIYQLAPSSNFYVLFAILWLLFCAVTVIFVGPTQFMAITFVAVLFVWFSASLDNYRMVSKQSSLMYLLMLELSNSIFRLLSCYHFDARKYYTQVDIQKTE